MWRLEGGSIANLGVDDVTSYYQPDHLKKFADIAEGSPEWDILYAKFVEEERDKRRRVR